MSESSHGMVIGWAQVIVPAGIIIGASIWMDKVNTAVLAAEIKHGFEVMAEVKNDVINLGDKVSSLEKHDIRLASDLGNQITNLTNDVKQYQAKVESDFLWVGKRFDRIEAKLPKVE
jgi:hypothetical protein